MVVTDVDQFWVADITYIRLQDEFVFLAVIPDACSRRVIRWALERTLEDELTLAALPMALSQRAIQPGLVHHSDRGCQYASTDYTGLLKAHGIDISMSRKANRWDNAACESFMKSLKYWAAVRRWSSSRLYWRPGRRWSLYLGSTHASASGWRGICVVSMNSPGPDEAWAFQHTVACPVTREFAWRFWTDVRNWRFDVDIESIELNGPFAAGSHGVTVTRSSGRIEWRLTDVQSGSEVVFEICLPGAILRFRWKFEDLGGRTRMTQRVGIEGEQALSLVTAVASSLEPGIPAGMQKLCETMSKAAADAFRPGFGDAG